MVAPASGWGNSPPGGAVRTVTSEGTMTLCNWKKQYSSLCPSGGTGSTPQTGRDLGSRKELGCPLCRTLPTVASAAFLAQCCLPAHSHAWL